MNGLIFNIQKFCTKDGPGIRTTVFLKGCPLNCDWCHNPESKKREPELLCHPQKCLDCGRCAAVCPARVHTFGAEHLLDRQVCKGCGACAAECPTHALELAGQEQSVEAVLKEVLRDRAFYEGSGGGLTLSGGEPLAQPEFTYELLRQAKEQGLHTCLETCGLAPTEVLMKIATVTDLFLFDWKVTDDALHRNYTGGSNQLIRQNLQALDQAGAAIILKCPIIPGVNDTPDHFAGIGELADSLQGISGIEIEPYHPLGIGKEEQLGQSPKTFPVPEEGQIEGWLQAIQGGTRVPVKRA